MIQITRRPFWRFQNNSVVNEFLARSMFAVSAYYVNRNCRLQYRNSQSRKSGGRMGIEQSMIQKRVGHDRITSFHTLYFKIFELLGAWIFMIFSTYVYRCATHKWLETAFICFYPRNGKIVLFLKFKYFLFVLSRIDQLSEVILISEAAVFRCFHCMCSRR